MPLRPALSKMINNQGHEMTDGLVISRDDTTEAALARVRNERGGILAQIAEYDAVRKHWLNRTMWRPLMLQI